MVFGYQRIIGGVRSSNTGSLDTLGGDEIAILGRFFGTEDAIVTLSDGSNCTIMSVIDSEIRCQT